MQVLGSIQFSTIHRRNLGMAFTLILGTLLVICIPQWLYAQTSLTAGQIEQAQAKGISRDTAEAEAAVAPHRATWKKIKGVSDIAVGLVGPTEDNRVGIIVRVKHGYVTSSVESKIPDEVDGFVVELQELPDPACVFSSSAETFYCDQCDLTCMNKIKRIRATAMEPCRCRGIPKVALCGCAQ
jgi:hypothetical protein